MVYNDVIKLRKATARLWIGVIMMTEYMEYFKEEILRGLRLFGWANDNSFCITQWAKEYNLSECEVTELRAYNKAMSRLPEYQF